MLANLYITSKCHSGEGANIFEMAHYVDTALAGKYLNMYNYIDDGKRVQVNRSSGCCALTQDQTILRNEKTITSIDMVGFLSGKDKSIFDYTDERCIVLENDTKLTSKVELYLNTYQTYEVCIVTQFSTKTAPLTQEEMYGVFSNCLEKGLESFHSIYANVYKKIEREKENVIYRYSR